MSQINRKKNVKNIGRYIIINDGKILKFYNTVAQFTLDARNVEYGTSGVPLNAVSTRFGQLYCTTSPLPIRIHIFFRRFLLTNCSRQTLNIPMPLASHYCPYQSLKRSGRLQSTLPSTSDHCKLPCTSKFNKDSYQPLMSLVQYCCSLHAIMPFS
jgi:hypothetical protein